MESALQRTMFEMPAQPLRSCLLDLDEEGRELVVLRQFDEYAEAQPADSRAAAASGSVPCWWLACRIAEAACRCRRPVVWFATGNVHEKALFSLAYKNPAAGVFPAMSLLPSGYVGPRCFIHPNSNEVA